MLLREGDYSELIRNIEEKSKADFSALPLDSYLKKEHIRKFSKNNLGEGYPKKIKIAASVQEMINAGKPYAVKEIVINEPLEFNGMPVWYNTTSKGIDMLMGNLNGDSANGCTLKMGDNKPEENMVPHWCIGATTGMGKSVGINGMILGACTEYAPWELKIIASDPKIVEFSKYGNTDYPLPHISAIAATEDVEYLVSILADAVKEMGLLNTVFGFVGCTNIDSFRKKTGLVIPRTLIILDEAQTGFKKATPEQKKLIAKYLDALAKMGRNAGYHLCVCSQSPEDFDQSTLAQITGRIALGCSAKVSEMLIGNDECQYIKAPGKMIANLDSGSSKDNRDSNQMHIVPYLPDDKLENLRDTFAETMYKQFDYRHNLNFYVEERVIREKDYPEYLEKEYTEVESTIKYLQNQGDTDINNGMRILLGEPNRLNAGSCVYFALDRDLPLGSVGIVDTDRKEALRFIKMLAYNICGYDVKNFLLAGSIGYINKLPLLVSKALNKAVSGKVLPCNKIANPYLMTVIYNYYIRKIVCEVDINIFETRTNYPDTIVYKALMAYFKRTGLVTDTSNSMELNRIKGLASILKSDPNIAGKFGVNINKIDNSNFEKVTFNPALKTFLDIIRRSPNSQIEYSNEKILQDIVVWLLDINSIAGLEKLKDTQFIKELGIIISDSHSVGIHWIISTKGINNTDAIFKEIGYTLYNSINGTNVKTNIPWAKELLPSSENERPVLGVLIDSNLQDVKQFKKMYENGESIK